MIGILEVCVKNHSVLVDSWIYCLRKKGQKTVLFTTDEIAKGLKESADIIKTKAEKDSINIFFQSIKKDIQKYHLNKLIITSVQLYYLDFLFLKPKIDIWLTLHNGATWFGLQKISIGFYIKRRIRNEIIKNSSALLVGSSNIKQYINSTGTCNKPVHIFPFTVFRQLKLPETPKHTKKLVVVIPGGFSTHRKKYETILNAIVPIKNKIKLVFLGSPVVKEGGTEILTKIIQLKNDGFDIKYFTEFISSEEYDLQLHNSDLIFSELNVNYKRYGHDEVYGETKDSGVSYTMISHSLPGIFNNEFKNHIELDNSTIYFRNQKELIDIFRRFIENPSSLREMKVQAKENSKKFGLDHLDILNKL